jgi:flagellar biosynthesis component FlhA
LANFRRFAYVSFNETGRSAQLDLAVRGTNMVSAMKSFVIGTLSVVFLVTASNAQQASGGQKRHQQKTDRSATQTTAKADEKAYNAALKSIPNKPWFGTRLGLQAVVRRK